MSDDKIKNPMQQMAEMYSATMTNFNKNFVAPLVELNTAAIKSITPKPIEEFSECEIDGVLKTYVEGKWLDFDEFIELFKTYREAAK